MPLINHCQTDLGTSMSSGFLICGAHSHLSTLNLHLPQSDPPLISSFGPTLTHTLTPPITELITINAHAQNVYHHSVLPTSLLK